MKAGLGAAKNHVLGPGPKEAAGNLRISSQDEAEYHPMRF